MKFECHHCGQHMEAGESARGSVIDCPGCAGKIHIPIKKASRAARIADDGSTMSASGTLLFVLAALAGLFAITSAVANVMSAADWLAGIAGFSFCVGLFLKLMAQLFYIRAELVKANEARE